MSIIGEYRMGVYELLYKYPICNYSYSEKEGGARHDSVLILGSGWIGNEAFKACLWAGQSYDSRLKITVASENADEYKELITGEKSRFPGVSAFLKDYPETTLSFVKADADDTDGLLLDRENYTYIIISLGDDNDTDDEIYNALIAEEIIEKLKEIKYDHKPLIAVFGKSKIPEADRERLSQTDCAEVVFFDREKIDNGSELTLCAKNINYAYEMYYDERVSRTKADGNFNEKLNKEFIEEPEDKEKGDLGIVNNFYGSSYEADSSYASAVHTAVKLRVCENLKNNKEERPPEEILSEFIIKKDEKDHKNKYNVLLELEHRRWYAYMAMRGFRAPSPEEEKKYLYSEKENTDHRDKTRLLHMCMCRSDASGVKLGCDVSKWDTYYKSDDAAKKLSDLDRASLRAHRLADEASGRFKQAVSHKCKKFDKSVPAVSNYVRSTDKMFNEEYNSVYLYESAYKELLADDASKGIIDDIAKIHSYMRIVKARNQRIDFASIDGQLIEFLPFCLWYRRKYGTVITVTDGMPLKDVVISTLFCAEKAVFLTKHLDKNYVEITDAYFKNRGGNTTTEYISVQNADTLKKALAEHINALASGSAIINIVDNDPETGVLIGSLAAQNKVTVVSYHPVKGILCYTGNKMIGAGLNNKNLSVDEVIRLLGGERSNTYSSLSSGGDREKLIGLLKKYYHINCDIRTNKNASGLFIWNDCSKFFQTYASNEKPITDGENTGEIKEHKGKINARIFDRCGFKALFSDLEKYRIISDFSKTEADGYCGISFKYRDEELIKNVISKFERTDLDPDIFTERVSFSREEGITMFDLNVKDKPFYDQNDDPDEKKRSKKKFELLKELEDCRFISNLTYEDKDGKRYVSFKFRDKGVRSLLKKQGTAFEEAVYHLFHEYGAFGDVQTGVKIKWNINSKSYYDRLDEKLSDKNSEECGYSVFKNSSTAAKRQSNNDGAAGVENEVDVIATHKMTAIFGSCKTNVKLEKEWIYEINSVADHFFAIPVMIVALDCNKKSDSEVIFRAKQMDVSMIGTETLWDENNTIKALEEIKKGKTVSPI